MKELSSLSNHELNQLIKEATTVWEDRPAEPLTDDEMFQLRGHDGNWAKVMLAYMKRTGLPRKTAKEVVLAYCDEYYQMCSDTQNEQQE